MGKKIYFCTDGIFPHAVGGIQRHSRCLIEAFAAENIPVVVLHPHNLKVFELAGVEEVYIPGISEQSNYLLESYRYSKRVFEYLADKTDGIIYAQGFTVWHGLNRLRMPVVVNPHGLESYQALGWKDRLKGVPFRWIFNSIFRSADHVVSEGGRLTGILKRILGDDGNIVTFYNGVNPPADPIERSFAGVRRFLFVGRFVRNKGLHVLFRVLEKLPPEIMQRSDFTLAGSGPLLDTYRQASKWSNVHFTGFIDDASLLRLYEDSHVFLLPTLFEGMPTVVLEAMGKSMPVIVSDVGGTSVMVNHENGFLLEAGHEQQLLDAVTAMTLADPETLQQLGRVSFRRVWENHSWAAIAQQHISFFCSLGLERKS